MVFDNVPQTSEDVRKWLDWFFKQWRKNDFGDWMIFEKANHGPFFIGRCGLRDYEDTNNFEIATSLCECARARGLSREAARFAIRHALQNSNKEKVVAVIKRGNAIAARATKKFGLRYIDDRWHAGRLWQYFEMTARSIYQAEQQVPE